VASWVRPSASVDPVGAVYLRDQTMRARS